MPTAAEFTGWATDLDAMHADLSAVARATPGLAPREIMLGTESELLVGTAVEQITGNASIATIYLGALADLCRARSLTCEQYTDQYRAWERGMDSYAVAATAAMASGAYVGSPPRPPPSPPSWVTVG